jgi:hypothetical protein
MSSKGAKSEAKSKQGFTRAAAGEVPLDYGAELTQSLKDIAKYSPQAQKQALATGAGEQDLLDALREKSAPGSKARQEKILSTIDSYLRGELSPEMQRNISRSGAAQGAARFGSLGGSIPYRAEAAALGRATEQQQMAGMGMLGQYQQLFPMAQAPTLLSFLGGGPSQTLARRSQEQSSIANILSGMPATPSGWSAAGQATSQVGGMAMGAGFTKLAAGGMGGGGGSGLMTPTAAPAGTVNMGSSMSAPYGYGTMPNYYGR